MKKFLLLALAAGLAFPVAGFAEVKVGTVDMNRAFKEYNKTKDAEKKINEARDAAKKNSTTVLTATKRRSRSSISSSSSWMLRL